jgi:small GTP-binding protein
MVDIKKFDALLDWYVSSLGENIKTVIIADRDGLLLGGKSNKPDVDQETLGGLSTIVEPILKKIGKEFKSTGFGAGTFDTENYRLIFIESGPQAILVTVCDLYCSLDDVFPYAYLMAEKVARILDGRPVSPVIPKLSKRGELKVPEKQGEFQQIAAEGQFIYKIILGGDGAVGKTSLIQTFVQGTFETDYKATIGTSIMKKECKFQGWNSSVRFMIWDLAGQGQFARVRQSYLIDAKGGLLVFDVTRPETFTNIEKWFKEVVQGAGQNIVVILIGNKIDLVNERKVTKEQGEQLAAKLQIPYFETSALNKDIVEEAFKMLAFRLLQDKLAAVKKK